MVGFGIIIKNKHLRFFEFLIHNLILQDNIIRDTKIMISKEIAKTFNYTNQI